KMDFNQPGQDTPVPGNISAADRFQRAAYFSKFFPEPKDMQQAFATILAAIRSVSVPFGTPYNKLGDGFPVYNTEYRTVCDLSHGVYGFELTTTPNFFWVELALFQPEKAKSSMSLTPGSIDLAGEVSGQFKPAHSPF
ncbi:MAG: linear amide C-N hydrolase, partial [Verrucomicrobia bacterium]|nr:linear amide C-N hydrolase [Verrucomicrobiota bacterium]